MSGNELNIMCVIFLRKSRHVNYGTIAYSEGHNGGSRSSPKHNANSIQGLRGSPGATLPLGVTYIFYCMAFIFILVLGMYTTQPLE